MSQDEKKEINDIFRFGGNEVNFKNLYEILGKEKKDRLTKKEIAYLNSW